MVAILMMTAHCITQPEQLQNDAIKNDLSWERPYIFNRIIALQINPKKVERPLKATKIKPIKQSNKTKQLLTQNVCILTSLCLRINPRNHLPEAKEKPKHALFMA